MKRVSHVNPVNVVGSSVTNNEFPTRAVTVAGVGLVGAGLGLVSPGAVIGAGLGALCGPALRCWSARSAVYACSNVL